jgi:hypothetical protein
VGDDFIRHIERCGICEAVRAKDWRTHDVVVIHAGANSSVERVPRQVPVPVAVVDVEIEAPEMDTPELDDDADRVVEEMRRGFPNASWVQRANGSWELGSTIPPESPTGGLG